MDDVISVIIPNRNGSATIVKCLEAVHASAHARFEVIVVDDCSEDDSVRMIRRFPCRLIQLEDHQGASRARNRGALQSRGRVLFFIDADCIVGKDTLTRAEQAARRAGPGVVIGGTYTAEPHDKDFFSRFQSAFIRFFETKRPEAPDYVASHAMIMHAETFRRSGGFPETFLPIIEDVHLSHRMRKAGCRLLMDPTVEVTHIFNFSFMRSLRNAFRKSFYWTIYSLGNRDLFADSGTASAELKVNVAAWLLTVVSGVSGIVFSLPALMGSAPALLLANMLVNRKLLQFFRKTGGSMFGIKACLYYLLAYPVPVGAGACAAVLKHALDRIRLKNRTRQSLPKEAI